MKPNRTLDQVAQEIRGAEGELAAIDARALRLWERIRVAPELWSQDQYPIEVRFWVVALMGRRCLYYNLLEGGWGWGAYERPGRISAFHCDDAEIHHIVCRTLFGIDEGGTG